VSGDGQPAVPPGTLERISDGIIAVDTERRVTYLNDRAGQFLGAAGQSPVGQDLWTVFPDSGRDAGQAAVERAIETVEETGRHPRQPVENGDATAEELENLLATFA